MSLGLDHNLGNPIFAIETSLDPLRKRILEGRTQEALEVVEIIAASVENAKQALDRHLKEKRKNETAEIVDYLCDIVAREVDRMKFEGVSYESILQFVGGQINLHEPHLLLRDTQQEERLDDVATRLRDGVAKRLHEMGVGRRLVTAVAEMTKPFPYSGS
jgi:hypothetical protein